MLRPFSSTNSFSSAGLHAKQLNNVAYSALTTAPSFHSKETETGASCRSSLANVIVTIPETELSASKNTAVPRKCLDDISLNGQKYIYSVDTEINATNEIKTEPTEYHYADSVYSNYSLENTEALVSNEIKSEPTECHYAASVCSNHTLENLKVYEQLNLYIDNTIKSLYFSDFDNTVSKNNTTSLDLDLERVTNSIDSCAPQDTSCSIGQTVNILDNGAGTVSQGSCACNVNRTIESRSTKGQENDLTRNNKNTTNMDIDTHYSSIHDSELSCIASDSLLEKAKINMLRNKNHTSMYEKNRKKRITNRLYSNRQYNKTALQKKKPIAANNKSFSKEQIHFLLDVIYQNTNTYRLFIRNYFKCVYPYELPANILNAFSNSNTLSLRSLTLRTLANKGVVTHITEEDYDVGKLHTDFSAYYKNNALSIPEELLRMNRMLKKLYVCYERGDAFYNVTNSEVLSLRVYRYVTENTTTNAIDKEKSLFYANQLFKSVSTFPIIMNQNMYVRKIFIYNLLIYASTQLDLSVLTSQNKNQYFRLELERIFKAYLLPEETDYVHVLVFIGYLENKRSKKAIFSKKMTNPDYAKPIAFYHFKYLYYVFYNIHRLGPFTQDLFYRSNMDFPDSLIFLSSIIDRFLTNTLHLLFYKKIINVDSSCVSTKFTLLDYVLKNGLKYLNNDISLEQRLENLLNDTISLLNLKARPKAQ